MFGNEGWPFLEVVLRKVNFKEFKGAAGDFVLDMGKDEAESVSGVGKGVQDGGEVIHGGTGDAVA